jgi:hypothetical protein
MSPAVPLTRNFPLQLYMVFPALQFFMKFPPRFPINFSIVPWDTPSTLPYSLSLVFILIFSSFFLRPCFSAEPLFRPNLPVHMFAPRGNYITFVIRTGMIIKFVNFFKFCYNNNIGRFTQLVKYSPQRRIFQAEFVEAQIYRVFSAQADWTLTHES